MKKAKTKKEVTTKLTSRQKDILLRLIEVEIDEGKEDEEVDEDYLEELEDLSEVIFKMSRHESRG